MSARSRLCYTTFQCEQEGDPCPLCDLAKEPWSWGMTGGDEENWALENSLLQRAIWSWQARAWSESEACVAHIVAWKLALAGVGGGDMAAG